METLLEPDERGCVDRRSMFRFIKCMLPSAPDGALGGVLDDFMETLQMDDSRGKEKGGDSSLYSGSNSSSNNSHNKDQVLIGTILERGDFIDRLTLQM